MSRALCLAILLLVPGCALFQAERPTVTVDYGAAALLYADSKSAYVLLSQAIRTSCAAGKLTPATCAAAGKIDDQAALLDTYARDVIRDPKREVDWARVTAFLGAVVSLALKLAP